MTLDKTVSQHRQPKHSSFRLMWTMRVFAKVLVGKINVVGQERLESLPADVPVVVAVTHISDIDIPLVVLALGSYFDFVVTDISIHRNFRDSIRSVDPTIVGILIAGIDNFLPITYVLENGKRKGQINPDDRIQIGQALKAGKTVVIAAHNPTFDGKLPDAPGYLAVRIAQSVENTVVIPVTIQIGKGSDRLGLVKTIVQTILKRPAAKISIGEPLIFNNPAAKRAAATVEDILDRRRRGLEQADDQDKLQKAKQIVIREGSRLMRALAKMLPPERRGKWGAEMQDNF